MSSSYCCLQFSQEAGQVVWYSHLLRNFSQFLVIHTVKGSSTVNKAEIDVFLELSCFFDDPTDVGNLISGSSAFSKFSLNVWKFMVHYGEEYGLNIELPHDPAIPLLDIYPEKSIIQKGTCNPMFTAALFTTARTCKQPNHPLTDEWIKMWYIYTMGYYSAINNWNWIICSEVNGPTVCHTEWSKSERESTCLLSDPDLMWYQFPD